MRRPKPFFRKQTQAWYVQIGKRQINLGKDEGKAWDQYNKIMAQREVVDIPDDAVCNVLNRYLTWVQQNRSDATYKKCRLHLRRFAQSIGRSRRISQLKKHHVQQWIDDDYKDKSTTYQHTAISTVVAALNWALSMDYIDRNPVANMRKPARKVREFFLKPEQWRELLGAISDRQFADVVAFMLFTGARPQESRVVEARHYDKAHGRLVFSRYESKGEKRQRVIYLDDTAREIVERLIKRYPEGTIFRNREGECLDQERLQLPLPPAQEEAQDARALRLHLPALLRPLEAHQRHRLPHRLQAPRPRRRPHARHPLRPRRTERSLHAPAGPSRRSTAIASRDIANKCFRRNPLRLTITPQFRLHHGSSARIWINNIHIRS